MTETKTNPSKEYYPVSFYEDASGIDHNALQCPLCGEHYLHQRGVREFEPDSDINALPSRGGGIIIPFSCEYCIPPIYLAITQHKGNTFMQWIKQ